MSSEASALPTDFERTLFIGSFIGAMAWGIHLSVYGAAMYFLYNRLRQKRLASWTLMVFMTVVFALSTMYIGTNIDANVIVNVDHGNDPEGPLVDFVNAFHTTKVLVGNNIGPVITIFLTDALLVWRLYVIWSVFWMAALGIILLIGSTVMGIFFIYTIALPGHNFNSADAVNFGTAYFSISLSLTVIITLVIVFRLLYIQYKMTKALGNEPEYRDHYVSTWTILLESSAMYAIVGLLFLVLYNKNNAISNVFEQLMVQVRGISSDLIILRVAIGNAWTARTSEKYSSLVFDHSQRFAASSTNVGSSEHSKHEKPSSGELHQQV